MDDHTQVICRVAPHKAIPILIILSILAGACLVVSPILGAASLATLCFVAISLRDFRVGAMTALFTVLALNKLQLHYASPNRHLVEPISFIGDAAVLLAFLVYCVRRLCGIERGTERGGVELMMGIFTLWTFAGMAWSGDLVHGSTIVLQMAINLMTVAIVFSMVRDEEGVKRMVNFFLAAGFFLGVVTMSSKFFTDEEVYGVASRLSLVLSFGGDVDKVTGDTTHLRAGGFSVCDHAAFMLNFFVFVSLHRALAARSLREKWLFMFLTFYFCVCVSVTGSMGAAGSLVVGLFVAVFFHPALRHKRFAWCGWVVALFVMSQLVSYVAFNESRILGSIIRTKGGAKIASRSYGGRMEIWSRGFAAFFDTEGWGLGTGGSAMYAHGLPHMHSFFFSALFDLGVIGFVLYMALLLAIAVRLMRGLFSDGAGANRGLLACMLGAFAAAMIQGLTITEYCFVFEWIILAFVAGISMPAQEGKEVGLRDERDSRLPAG